MDFARGLIVLGHAAALAACSSGGGGSQSSQAASPSSASANRVSCAVGGAQAFAETCTLEHAQGEGAPILVIRHADGGFRRFAVKDGSVTEADGAERAVIARSGATLDVAVGADRYQLNVSQIGNVH